MQKIGLNELREKYLSFFEKKEHLRLPSFSLLPHNDPSLLLINSGMAPFKPYFAGIETPPSKRITTCQKCIRTPDIEIVGKTARHFTFFEMLGNFSFGDYFKEEAIKWAWEFITKELSIPLDKLYVSVYKDDDETYEFWDKNIGVEKNKIVRLGKEDNYWEHGLGPCGPCSEIYVDKGSKHGCDNPNCAVGCECDRYVEVWNLVFTEFDKQEDGSYGQLKNKNIDTGMGIERIACFIQGVDSVFEVDTVFNILQTVSNISNVKYKSSESTDISLRVITDHIRSTVMMICDGVIPSNEGKGYVLRRLLRRAARHGKLLGINGLFLNTLADKVFAESGLAYPELIEKKDYIKKVVKVEEEKFQETVDQGLLILKEHIDSQNKENKSTINGDFAFKLHDTYGFPFDLTKEIANESNLEIDEHEFKVKIDEQKKRSRKDYLDSKGNNAWSDSSNEKFNNLKPTEFTGYSDVETNSKTVIALVEGSESKTANEGDNIILALDKTPFYAESGGQVGDTGIIFNDEVEIVIQDCQKNASGVYIHTGYVKTGVLNIDHMFTAKIDTKRRSAIEKNHTATHILQKALRNKLGTHVNQAGSLVEPDRLRFDFTHFSAISKDELSSIESEVNQIIMANALVSHKEMPIDDAKKLGAAALFGEKYADIVRVVSLSDYSLELCGGTHVKNSSEISLIKILSENGVASGVRRIEAITGESAINYLNEKNDLLNELLLLLKATPEDCAKKLTTLNSYLKSSQKEIERLNSKLVGSNLDSIIKNSVSVNGINIITARFDDMDADRLRTTSDQIKSKTEKTLIVLASTLDDKVTFISSITKDLLKSKVHAGKIIKEVAKIANGSGGGRPDMAQAGAKDITKVNDALNHVSSLVKELEA